MALMSMIKLFLCVAVLGMVAFAPQVTAITCEELSFPMNPCAAYLYDLVMPDYLKDEGFKRKLANDEYWCCRSIREDVLTSNPKDVCNCLKDPGYHTKYLEIGNAFSACNVTHSFPISKDADCSSAKW